MADYFQKGLIETESLTTHEPAPIRSDSETFEKAYYSNSYPKESSKTKTLISTIKVVSVLAILIEVAFSAGLGAAVY